jgi:hypothetical protein
MGVSGAKWKKARRLGLNTHVNGWAGWVLESLAVMAFTGLMVYLTLGQI